MCGWHSVKYLVKWLIAAVAPESFFFYFFMVYLSLFYVHWCEGIRSPGTGFSDSYELPCGCWELNPGPREEQSVLLTAEPSLQPPR